MDRLKRGGRGLAIGKRQKGTAVIQDDLKSFLSGIQAAFFAGDMHALFQSFQIPLVVYSAAGVVVLRNEAEFERLAQDYLDAIKALSVTQGRQTILERDTMVHNRQRVTVRSVEMDAAGTPVTSSTIRYFVVKSEDGYAVEMLEYLEMPLPVSDVEKIIH